jgi:hypothetical protein
VLLTLGREAPGAHANGTTSRRSTIGGEIRDVVVGAFPEAAVTFQVDQAAGHRRLVAGDVDDTAARVDWAFHPRAISRAFSYYLIPAIRRATGSLKCEV